MRRNIENCKNPITLLAYNLVCDHLSESKTGYNVKPVIEGLLAEYPEGTMHPMDPSKTITIGVLGGSMAWGGMYYKDSVGIPIFGPIYKDGLTKEEFQEMKRESEARASAEAEVQGLVPARRRRRTYGGVKETDKSLREDQRTASMSTTQYCTTEENRKVLAQEPEALVYDDEHSLVTHTVKHVSMTGRSGNTGTGSNTETEWCMDWSEEEDDILIHGIKNKIPAHRLAERFVQRSKDNQGPERTHADIKQRSEFLKREPFPSRPKYAKSKSVQESVNEFHDRTTDVTIKQNTLIVICTNMIKGIEKQVNALLRPIKHKFTWAINKNK